MVYLSGCDLMMQAEAQDVPMFAYDLPEQSLAAAVIAENCGCWCCSACLMQSQRSRRRRKDHPSSSSDPLGSSPAKHHRTSCSSNGSSDCFKCAGLSESPHLAHSVLALTVSCPCGQAKEQSGRTTSDFCRHCEENQNNIMPDLLSPFLLQHNGLSSSLLTGDIKQNCEIVPVEAENDEVQSQFVNAFLHNNRLEHITQVIGYHPQYLESFLKTQQYLLRGDGPLPYDYRHYIAIMAAGRHQCSYLIHIQTTEFLLQGGDERWLKGLQFAPKKLQDLYELNKVMAHRPWLVSKLQIEKLTRGADNWSLSELMHAIVIIAHFHALSSFVYGCGISAEIDQDEGHTYRPASSSTTPVSGSPHSYTPNSHGEEGGIDFLMKRMKEIDKEKQQEVTEEELLERFQHIENQFAELPASTRQPSPHADILRYVEDPDFTYEDFAKRGATPELPTFRAQDYSWADHGFSLANRLYTDIGNLLDEKFRIAYNLTYYTMGDNEDVDTSSFRQAIWYYIQCMFGIRHDDYNYSEINQLLERNLKSYVKTTTCFPERITKKDYDSFMREFKHSEKVHVNLMLFEARLQAELLYGLRALMRHMT